MPLECWTLSASRLPSADNSAQLSPGPQKKKKKKSTGGGSGSEAGGDHAATQAEAAARKDGERRCALFGSECLAACLPAYLPAAGRARAPVPASSLLRRWVCASEPTPAPAPAPAPLQAARGGGAAGLQLGGQHVGEPRRGAPRGHQARQGEEKRKGGERQPAGGWRIDRGFHAAAGQLLLLPLAGRRSVHHAVLLKTAPMSPALSPDPPVPRPLPPPSISCARRCRARATSSPSTSAATSSPTPAPRRWRPRCAPRAPRPTY